MMPYGKAQYLVFSAGWAHNIVCPKNKKLNRKPERLQESISDRNPLSQATKVAVTGNSGNRKRTEVVDTNSRVLIEFARTIWENGRVCIGEGTQSNRLHEVFSLHVQKIVFAGVR